MFYAGSEAQVRFVQDSERGVVCEIVFVGEWNGQMVSLVQRRMARAYRVYQNNKRKEGEKEWRQVQETISSESSTSSSLQTKAAQVEPLTTLVTESQQPVMNPEELEPLMVRKAMQNSKR